jgi:hypothetical protein
MGRQLVEQLAEKVVQPGKGQASLRFSWPRDGDAVPATASLGEGCLPDGALTDAGVAGQQERACTCRHPVQEMAHGAELGLAANDPHDGPRCSVAAS